MPAELPGISIGKLGSARRCQRLLAALIDPEVKSRPTVKGAFRLDSAVREAIRVAHEIADQRGNGTVASDTIDLGVPPGLSHEERVRFPLLLERYVEFVGDEVCSLHSSSGEYLAQTSKSGRFRLTGRNDTSVVRVDGVLEVRRIHSGSWRPKQSDRDSEDPNLDELAIDDLDADTLLVYLIIRARPSAPVDGVMARVRHLWLGNEPNEVIHEVSEQMISEAGRRLSEFVERALDNPTPSPGWWCSSCPVIKTCPVVFSSTDSELSARIRTSSS